MALVVLLHKQWKYLEEPKMNNIIVLGASGHAKVIVDMIHCMKKRIRLQWIFLLDDKEILIGVEVLGHKAIGKISECMKYK